MTSYREKFKWESTEKGFEKKGIGYFCCRRGGLQRKLEETDCVRKEAGVQSAWGSKSIYDILISSNEIVAKSQVSVPQYY